MLGRKIVMTEVTPGGVKLLLERFPHVKAVSLHLLVKNEAFRELCEEYEACAEAAERLARTGGDEAIRKEYTALQLRLEGELLSYLSQHVQSQRTIKRNAPP